MRQPLARTLAALVALVALACGGDAKDVNKNIARDLKYAHVRLLQLVADQPSMDVVVQCGDAPPVTFGNVRAGSLASSRDVEVGDCAAYLLRGGPPLAQVAFSVQEGKRYTLIAAGETASGAATQPSLAWEEETIAPHEGMVVVRFLLGVPSAIGATVTLGGETIADDVQLAQMGAFQHVMPGTQTLTVTKDGKTVAEIPPLALGGGEVHTFALVTIPQQTPGQLLDVQERVDAEATAKLVGPTAAGLPPASLRFVNLAPGSNPVDVRVDGNTIAHAVGFKELAAPADVQADAQISVQDDGVDVLTPQKLPLQPEGHYTAALLGGTNKRLVFWNDAHGAIAGRTARFANMLSAAPPIPMPATQGDGSALFPATMPGATSAYQTVPAGPIDVVVQLMSGTNPLLIGRFPAVTFPAGVPLTAVLAGTFAAPPGVSDTSLLLIDDQQNKVIADVPHATAP